MALTTLKWINLRGTVAFKADGTNQGGLPEDTPGSGNLKSYPVAFVLDGDSHNAGWSVGGGTDGARDRSSGVDARLAGSNFAYNTGTQKDFKVDLTSAGSWTIYLAVGDASNAYGYSYWQIYDNTTLLDTVTKATGQGSGQFWDANGNLHTSAANWVANQTGKIYTFATSTLIVRAGSPTAQTGGTSIATVGFQKVAAGGGSRRLVNGGLVNGLLVGSLAA